MTAQQFFQARMFKQFCAQYPLQNVVVSPLEVEMTLLKLARAQEIELGDLGVEGIEAYLGEREALVKELMAQYPIFFKLDMEKKGNESPLEFTVNLVYWSLLYPVKTDDFYGFNEQTEQSYLLRNSDLPFDDVFYFNHANFQALRLASKIKDVFIELYLPHSETDFLQFIARFSLGKFREWDSRFEEIGCWNGIIPKVDTSFTINYSDIFEHSLSLFHQKASLHISEGGIATSNNFPFKRFFITARGKLATQKHLDFNRPFFVMIRKRSDHSILALSAITNPTNKAVEISRKNKYLKLQYFEDQIDKLTIRGLLAIQYWCIQEFARHLKIRDKKVDAYLNLLQKSITGEKKLMLDYLESLDELYKNIIHEPWIDNKKNPAQELLSKILLGDIADSYEHYILGLITGLELAGKIGSLPFIKLMSHLDLSFPSIQHFSVFLKVNNNKEEWAENITGDAPKHFPIKSTFVDQLPPQSFINSLEEKNNKYRAYWRFKSRLSTMTIEEKVTLMAKCIEVYLKEEQLFLQEWEDLKPYIDRFVRLSSSKEKTVARQRIVDFKYFYEYTYTGNSKFKFFTEESFKNFFNTLCRNHYLLMQLLEHLGNEVYLDFENKEEFKEVNYKQEDFFKLYFLSKYPRDFLIPKS